MNEAARQLALVKTAICSGLSNCIEWKNRDLLERVRSNPLLQGLTSEGIVALLVSWIRDFNGTILQKAETRENWRYEYDFTFEVSIPVAGFERELFVELVLHDDDDEVPEVTIVSCHLTSFP